MEMAQYNQLERLKLREEYEDKHRGGYERIYPLREGDSNQLIYSEISRALTNFD